MNANYKPLYFWDFDTKLMGKQKQWRIPDMTDGVLPRLAFFL